MFRAAMLKKTIMTTAIAAVAFTVVSEWGSLQAKAPRVFARISDAVLNNDAPGVGSIEGEAAILIDERTGQVLYGKNERKRLYPASTTKLLTALIALEKAASDTVVTIGDEVEQQKPDESSAGLHVGQKLTLYDLIAAMMLPSGNDAARAIARYIASEEIGHQVSADEGMAMFAVMMNQRANELGAVESHFVNAHGLHDPDHYTTAADLARIARKARQNEQLRKIVSESEHQSEGLSATMAGPVFINRNKLLQPSSGHYFNGANGMKTGYTSAAGYCLVASAKRGENSYIAIILNSSSADVWSDASKLLQFGFSSKKR